MKLNNNSLFKNKYEVREDIYRSTEVMIPKKGNILFVGLDCITDVQHFDGTRNFKVLGIDKDPAKVERVKNLGVEAEVKDIKDIDDNEKFNLIWLAEGLNTLNDEEVLSILKKASKLLTKKGFIFCSFAYRYDDGKTIMSEDGINYRDEINISKLLKASNLKFAEDGMRIVKDSDDKVIEKWFSVLATNM